MHPKGARGEVLSTSAAVHFDDPGLVEEAVCGAFIDPLRIMRAARGKAVGVCPLPMSQEARFASAAIACPHASAPPRARPAVPPGILRPIAGAHPLPHRRCG